MVWLIVVLVVCVLAALFHKFEPLSRTEVLARARSAIEAADALRSRAQEDYLRMSQLTAWKTDWPAASQLILSWNDRRVLKDDPLWPEYIEVGELLDDVDQWVKNRNKNYVLSRLEDLGDWAKSRFEYPLTQQQLRAVVVDEDCNLVVAGAGTGKTSTLVAKIAFLIEHRQVNPGDILVLAFNKTVANEIRSRLEELDLSGPEISTFHAKGYDVLGRARGRKPAVSRLADDNQALGRFLQEHFEAHLATPSFRKLFSKWWVDLRVDFHELKECKTPDERIRKERSLGLRTLNGIQVRSQSECKVGDWLTLHGIPWAHEPTYPHTPPSPYRRDYTPDFHLTEHDIWIEVWACDTSEESFPEEINKDLYKDSMAWKRALHAEHGTVLVEIFQDEIWGRNPDLIGVLRKKLDELGLELDPPTPEELKKLLSASGEGDSLNWFITLIKAFLKLYRAGAWIRSEVEGKAESRRDKDFLSLFWPLHDDYMQALKEEKKIDFDEMLLSAGKELKDGLTVEDYRYILVDEFQDVSRARLELIRGLRGSVGSCRLFLVGDDWQAIYRFTGNDLDFFTQVEGHLGTTERTDLDQTFRLLSDVASLSTEFITRNKGQLTKQLTPRAQSSGLPGVSIRFHLREGEERAFARVLEDIVESSTDTPNVLVLGRYNYRLKDLEDPSELRKLTVHTAKGLEADDVIILGADAGRYGFPSEITDDRVLRLVMSAEDKHPNAEERRLFYVALTRTRGRVYLLANSQEPSPFIQELLEEDFAEWVELFGEESRRYVCPRCFGKTIRRREGQFGAFWGCINYSACRGRLQICPDCGTGVLRAVISRPKIDNFICSECQSEHAACRKCQNGVLMPKDGRYGPFRGCSEWRRDGSGCDHTERSPDQV